MHLRFGKVARGGIRWSDRREDFRTEVLVHVKAKQVKIAELEAEAAKIQQVKQAEGAAAVHVLQAKADSDAMQYTLPLKQKQIEQSKLEAEARKEATIQNAQADAEVVPAFYERDGDGLPRAWLARVKASLRTLGPRFSARRMLSEYVESSYLG